MVKDGIGGRTVAEAQENMSADEIMHWMQVYEWEREATEEAIDRQRGVVRPPDADAAADLLDGMLKWQ